MTGADHRQRSRARPGRLKGSPIREATCWEEAAEVGRLPFAIIGVPWHQSEHLPDVLSVAHEAGHHLQEDRELADVLKARLHTSGLSADRRTVREGRGFFLLVLSMTDIVLPRPKP
ncbi:hypothetical protein [Streptomyces sp. NPDC093094]|uniref:hypothetical protein n=1 Tax=Streptomyces sp. NPDC093094 TaxID=3366026 RepID=UPI0037FF55E1